MLSNVAKLAGLPDGMSFEMLRWTCALRDYKARMDPDRLRRKLGLSQMSWKETEPKIIRLAERDDRIVALRGDLPSGMGMGVSGDFRYANELVRFIREETGGRFHIEVAAYPEVHPQAPSAEQDLLNFKRKVEAGASAAITQYFYNPDAYFAFVESCERQGIDLPIVPGIMPITNYTQLARFSDACGAEIPRWIRKRLEGFGDDRESIRAFGHDVVLELGVVG